jgi:hypothetical protein
MTDLETIECDCESGAACPFAGEDYTPVAFRGRCKIRIGRARLAESGFYPSGPEQRPKPDPASHDRETADSGNLAVIVRAALDFATRRPSQPFPQATAIVAAARALDRATFEAYKAELRKAAETDWRLMLGIPE